MEHVSGFGLIAALFGVAGFVGLVAFLVDSIASMRKSHKSLRDGDLGD